VGGTSAVVAAGLAILIYAVLAVTAARHRLLARIAAREAFRRPAQAAVVVAGLTIGTAAILGPQIFTDSLFDSLIGAAGRQWGKVDITVSAGGASFSPDVAAQIAAGSANDAAIGGVQPGVDLVVSAADADSSLGAATVRFIGFDPGSQPSFGAYVLEDGTRTFGDDLAVGAVLLSQSLADDLQADQGDRLHISVDGRSDDLTVAGIVRPEGPGEFGLRPAMFASLATAWRLTGTDRVNVVRIAAAGEGQAERDATPVAASRIRSIVAGLAAGPALDVRDVKAQETVAYEYNQQAGRVLTLTFGLFAMTAGIALVINLALSLAEERRPRLALLRAIGLSRTSLVTISMLEAALYAFGAALLGLALGALYAWALTSYADNAFLDSVDGRDIPIQLSLRPATIVGAVALGALVTLLTMLVAAIRSSRMTIVSALRDLPEPRQADGRSLLRTAGLLVLGSAGVLAVVVGGVTLRFVGGWALIASAIGLTRGSLPDRARASLGGALLVAWGLVLLITQPATTGDIELTFETFLLMGITTALGLSFIAAANLRLLEGLPDLFGNLSGGLRGTMRPPLAYMTRRPVRAGLAAAAFGLVVATITAAVVIGTVSYEPDAARGAGGFDIVATSSGSLPAGLPASLGGQVSRVVSIPTRHYLGPQRLLLPSGTAAPDWHEQSIALHELSDTDLRTPLARLNSRDPRFASDDDAWRAVASDPSWVIASYGAQGGTVWLVGRDGPIERKIAGSFALGFLDGIVGSPQALAPFFDLPAGTTLLIKATPGTDVSALSEAIRRSMFSDGVDAATTASLLEQGQVQGRTWSELFRLWSVAGLLAGVLSIGVLTLRAALERKRAIGVLRALGAQRRNIMAGLLMEALLTAAVGVAVGLVAAVQIVYGFIDVTGRGTPIGDAWVGDAVASVALICGLVLLVTLGASLGASLRASRLAPIEALRTVD
jgi:putative ABC transport system permease protein